MVRPSKKNEAIKIAYYYYKLGMTQNEIAKKMSMSRQRVNRILKKCLETGVVKIVIQETEDQNVEFETEFEALTGLKEAVIVSADADNVNESLGPVAAAYLGRIINDGDVIGFSRGRALSSLVNNLEPTRKKDLTVMQLVGGQNADESDVNSDNIVRNSAEILRAKPHFLYAPIIVESRKLRDSMLNETVFAQMYNRMKDCTVAVVGIGDMSKESEFVTRSILTPEEVKTLREKSAIGEVCTHYFDRAGDIIQSDINGRVFAIDCNSFREIPIRIGICGGEKKLSAIEGAIRGGLINVLVTDYDTAQVVYQRIKHRYEIENK